MPISAKNMCITAVVRRTTNERLEKLASLMDVTKSVLVRTAIEEYLARKLDEKVA